MKWKHFPRYWPLVRGFHRSPANSPHKGQWRRALMFPLIYALVYGWVNNREAGDLRCHCAHYDDTVMVKHDCWIYMPMQLYTMGIIGYDIFPDATSLQWKIYTPLCSSQMVADIPYRTQHVMGSVSYLWYVYHLRHQLRALLFLIHRALRLTLVTFHWMTNWHKSTADISMNMTCPWRKITTIPTLWSQR